MAQQERSLEMPVVAVFGASGHTGRFVIAELLRRGFVPVAIGRDHEKLTASGFQDHGVAVRTACIDDPGSLARSFAGVHAVINCAGPFLDTADVVVAACLDAGIHYLDVTAEQASAAATFDKFNAPAREASVVVIPAMGFFGGLGDLLTTAAMGDWNFADDVRIGIALDNWWPTPGTRATGRRNTARRLVVEDWKLTPLPLPAPEMTWHFPDPFGRQTVTEVPFTEIVVIAQHLRISNLHTYLNQAPLRDLRDPNTSPPVATAATGRSQQKFLVEVIARMGTGTRRATARGRDIYAFTAPLVCEAVQRILDGVSRTGGAFSPGALFDARDYLRALARDALTLQIETD